MNFVSYNQLDEQSVWAWNPSISTLLFNHKKYFHTDITINIYNFVLMLSVVLVIKQTKFLIKQKIYINNAVPVLLPGDSLSSPVIRGDRGRHDFPVPRRSEIANGEHEMTKSVYKSNS